MAVQTEQILRNLLNRERQIEALQEMVQGIAHDLANLLETVGTAAELVTGGTPRMGLCRSSLDAALGQAGSLIAILQNCTLLDDEHLPVEAVDAGKVVEDVLRAALLELRAPLIRVVTDLKGLPKIVANAAVLARCLNNLVWNAVQAMPSGGVLEITGSVVGGSVTLLVADTGSGIPRNLRERIFEKHTSTKRGHQGMGLTLVRTLVRRMGGEVMLLDRPGFGTTFALSFPIAQRGLGPARQEGCAERPAELQQAIRQTEAG